MSSSFSNVKKFLMPIGVVVWVLFGYLLAQFVGLGVVYLMRWLGLPLEALGENGFTTVANILVYGLTLLILIGVPWWVKKWRTTRAELGLARVPRLMDFVWPLAGALVYVILTVVITVSSMVLIPGADYEQTQDVGFTALTNRWEFILAFLSLVIIAPVAEETIFRGYLQGKLQKYAPVWISVIITAAIFALAHLQFNVGLDTFALGIVLSVLRVVSKSLWPSIFLHMLKNGVAFYFIFVNPLFL